MFSNIDVSSIPLVVLLGLSLIWLIYGVFEAINQRKNCQHERFKLIHSETNYTNDLYEVKVNHYRCLGCGFIKKDEGFVNEE